MLIRIQCVDCKFGNSLKSIIIVEDFEGYSICSQYPNRIPDCVEEATKDCPKFEEKQ